MALALLLLILEFVLAIFALGIFIFLLVFLISFYVDVPFVPTPQRAFPYIIEALDYHTGDVVYELGSGDGSFLRASALSMPHAHFIGIERNPILVTYARMRQWLSGNPRNLTYRRDDFYKTDLRDATKIYVYLYASVMNNLRPILEQNSVGTRVVSRAFQFSNKTPTRIIALSKKPGTHGEHLLYVYEF